MFHGCPRCFPTGDRYVKKVPGSGRTFEDAYVRTMERKNFIKSQGYDFVELWECQLRGKLERDPEMAEFFRDTPVIAPLDPRQGFYGGRTNAIRLLVNCEGEEKIRYVDIVS